MATLLATACPSASPLGEEPDPYDGVAQANLEQLRVNPDGEYEEDSAAIAYRDWSPSVAFGGPSSPVGCTGLEATCRYYRSTNGTVRDAKVAGAIATTLLGAGQQLEYFGCSGDGYTQFSVKVTDRGGVVKSGWAAHAIARDAGAVRCNQRLLSFTNPYPTEVLVWLKSTAASRLAVDRLRFSTTAAGHPYRLTIVKPPSGPGSFADHTGASLVLRGGNTDGITAEEALDMKGLGLNFARFRITFTPGRDAKGDTLTGEAAQYNADESCLTPENKAIVAQAAHLADAGVWTLLELRADDTVTTNAVIKDGERRPYDWQFYSPVSAPTPPRDGEGQNYAFEAYRCAWRYVVDQFKNTDFIAGYGLLAEPSTNKTHPNSPEAPDLTETTLVEFQKAIMDDLVDSSGDLRTPFFVGTSWNYDSMNYRHQAYQPSRYATARFDHSARLAYEVNYLVPKPWINTGTDVDGAFVAYPQSAGLTDADLNALIPGSPPGATYPPVEKLYSDSVKVNAGFLKSLTREHLSWYLSGSVTGAPTDFALKFASEHHVPMIVDQFGATTFVWQPGYNDSPASWKDYEKDIIQTAEAVGLAGWARWGYNAGSQDRTLALGTGDAYVEKARSLYASRFYCRPGMWACP